MDWFLGVMSFLLGAVIGSFLNVCIYRIPNGISIADGRSRCTTCGHVIRWYDLIPVISYACLGGKCRDCKSPISPRYTVVELLTAVCFLLCWLCYGLAVETLLCMALIAVLIVLAFIDAATQEIPDRLPIAIAVLGVINIFFSGKPWWSHLIGLAVVSVPFLIIALFGGMGGGDVKLMAAAGLFLGWECTLFSLLAGSVVGLVAVIVMALLKKVKRGALIPFGPFLAAGIAAAALVGPQVINWYLTLIRA